MEIGFCTFSVHLLSATAVAVVVVMNNLAKYSKTHSTTHLKLDIHEGLRSIIIILILVV